MPYKRIDYITRLKIETLYNIAKYNGSRIVKKLGYSRSSIYAELKKGFYNHTIDYRDVIRYSAVKAHQKSKFNRSSGAPLKLGNDYAFVRFVTQKIKEGYSLDVIAHLLTLEPDIKTKVCTSTLYSYVRKGLILGITNKDLIVGPYNKNKSIQQLNQLSESLKVNL